LSFAADQRHPILDGNVKRVLARHLALDGWSGDRQNLETLWWAAEQRTPEHAYAEYNQAIMDLGATLCKRSKPRCGDCPVLQDCQAYQQKRVHELPVPRPRKDLPVRQTSCLIISDGKRILLERRPPTGIWGGLWSFPEVETKQALAMYCRQRWGFEIDRTINLDGWRHTFSHYHMDLQPVFVRCSEKTPLIMDDPDLVWYNIKKPDQRGLAAPVLRYQKMLQQKETA